MVPTPRKREEQVGVFCDDIVGVLGAGTDRIGPHEQVGCLLQSIQTERLARLGDGELFELGHLGTCREGRSPGAMDVVPAGARLRSLAMLYLKSSQLSKPRWRQHRITDEADVCVLLPSSREDKRAISSA